MNSIYLYVQSKLLTRNCLFEFYRRIILVHINFDIIVIIDIKYVCTLVKYVQQLLG